MSESNVQGLRSIVSNLDWNSGSSRWSQYAAESDHVRVHRRAEAAFIMKALAEDSPALVWDVGANDRYFSSPAAGSTGYVLVLDADTVILDDFYRSSSPNGPDNVLPIVQDLADPSPGVGRWGLERPPLIDRSSPDVVLCLAVVYHLVFGRNIPLRAVIDWLADLGSRAILEFVTPDDRMVRALTINKMPREVHRDYNETDLRRYLEEHFLMESEEELPGGTRGLFALRPIA